MLPLAAVTKKFREGRNYFGASSVEFWRKKEWMESRGLWNRLL
jgi:hypothetical protein